MTDNIEIESLRARAKELKIKGWHIMGAEKLTEAIAKAEVGAEEPEVLPVQDTQRKKAPRMKVETVKVNARQKKLDELNAANGEYEHQYRQAGTDPRVIEAQGFEVVDGESLGDEIVVRTMKDSFLEWQDAKNKVETDRMQKGLDDYDGVRVRAETAQPKSPRPENN